MLSEGRGASQAERRGAGGVGGRELAAGVRMGGEGEIQIGPCMGRDRKATRRKGGRERNDRDTKIGKEK